MDSARAMPTIGTSEGRRNEAKHLFIINPIAGGKKNSFEDTKQRIINFAEGLSDPYEIYVTKAPMDASRKVAEVADLGGDLYVYACGGDGTLNECVNGAVGHERVAVTHYPCGTGNDFIRTFGVSNIARFRDLDALSKGSVRALDIIDCNGRYCINICSVGIDARVGGDVHKYSRIPVIGGATGYVISLIVNVLKGVTQRLRVTCEDVALDKDITLVCACNGRFYGGGFNPVPDAIPDDGLLEILIIDAVSRFKVAQIVGKYAKGRYREIEGIITHLRSSSIEVAGDREFVVNIDGEIINAKKISLNLISKGINFIFPAGMEYLEDSV